MTLVYEPSSQSRATLALDDLRGGLADWRLWTMMGWHDIQKRYRRSQLGPFWLTLSMAVMVACLTVVYGSLLKQPIETFLPFLSIGLATWNLAAMTMTEGCYAFLDQDGLIKNIRMPLTVHAMRVVWRNLISYGHNIVIYFAIAVVFQLSPGAAGLLVFPGLLLFTLNLAWVTLLLSVTCTRFRDVPQIVGSVTQLLFFVTPVLWKPELLGERRWIVELNPLHHLMELVRAPLLGVVPAPESWGIALLVTAAGWTAAFLVFIRCRHRVVYWL